MYKAFLRFNRLSVFSCISLCILILGQSTVQAQDCYPPFEMITKLREPVLGALTRWTATFGEAEFEEQFIGIVDLDEGVMAVGTRRTFSGVRPVLLFTLFDNQGREVWHKTQSVNGLDDVVAVQKGGGGFTVLANQTLQNRKSGFWLGFFTPKGELVSQKSLHDPAAFLYARAIVPDAENDGWIVSATLQKPVSANPQAGVHRVAQLYALDSRGNEKFKRAYFLGGSSEILGLSVSKLKGGDSRYNATGRFDNSYGYSHAWVMRLRTDLSLEWQQEFRRGKAARLNFSAQGAGGYILVAGDTDALDDSARGVWFAVLGDDDGNVVLQRFFHSQSGRYDYSIRGLDVEESGRINLLMSARINDSAAQVLTETMPENGGGYGGSDYLSDYARVLSLSPRGITVDGAVYAHGGGAQIQSFVRLMRGSLALAGYAYAKETPDYSKPFSPEDVDKEIAPLLDQGRVNLPDVELSEETEKGLALLKQKISAADVVDISEESAHSSVAGDGLSQDGWVILTEPSPVYIDPCK